MAEGYYNWGQMEAVAIPFSVPLVFFVPVYNPWLVVGVREVSLHPVVHPRKVAVATPGAYHAVVPTCLALYEFHCARATVYV